MVDEVEGLGRDLDRHALVEGEDTRDASVEVVNPGAGEGVATGDGVGNAISSTRGHHGAGGTTIAVDGGGDGSVDESSDRESCSGGVGARELPAIRSVGGVAVGDGERGSCDNGSDEATALIDVRAGVFCPTSMRWPSANGGGGCVGTVEGSIGSSGRRHPWSSPRCSLRGPRRGG